MIKTSQLAYDLACSMTGYGFEAPPEPPTGDKSCPAAAPVDPLDYSRFENIDDEAEGDIQQILKDRSEQVAARALGRELTVQAPVSEDTSEYFDLKRSMLAQGCAHDRSKERALFERPNTEKLHVASRFRLEGNNAFKAQNYPKASSCYLRGLIQLEYMFPDSPLEEEQYGEIKLALHLNQAAAKLNLEDYDECANQCEQALKIDPKNAKALFRKAQCYTVWGKYDEAVALLRDSASFAPDTAAACEAAIAKTLGLKHKKADQSFFRNIFAKR